MNEKKLFPKIRYLFPWVSLFILIAIYFFAPHVTLTEKEENIFSEDEIVDKPKEIIYYENGKIEGSSDSLKVYSDTESLYILHFGSKKSLELVPTLKENVFVYSNSYEGEDFYYSVEFKTQKKDTMGILKIAGPGKVSIYFKKL